MLLLREKAVNISQSWRSARTSRPQWVCTTSSSSSPPHHVTRIMRCRLHRRQPRIDKINDFSQSLHRLDILAQFRLFIFFFSDISSSFFSTHQREQRRPGPSDTSLVFFTHNSDWPEMDDFSLFFSSVHSRDIFSPFPIAPRRSKHSRPSSSIDNAPRSHPVYTSTDSPEQSTSPFAVVEHNFFSIPFHLAFFSLFFATRCCAYLWTSTLELDL